jgi:succinate dehydrogenase/fumarate reductase iron-sulfur protein
MSNNTIKVKVSRYNPEIDKEGKLVEYTLEKEPGMRILGALKAINAQGANIAYRYGCEEWECGSCAIHVNGMPMLVCKTEIQDGMVLKPLPDLPVNRDLIVDRTKYFKKQDELYQKPEKLTGQELTFENQEKMWKSITCMECGICLAACPILHTTGKSYDYSGPEYMVQLHRLDSDNRRQKNALQTSVKEGIWECTACKYCEESCPQRVPILQDIIDLRGKIMEDQSTLVPETIRTLNTNLVRYSNAYGKQKSERSAWADGLDVPLIKDGEKELLLFVGDAEAYNKRDQATAQAFVKILKQAKVSFGILGDEEANAGDPALKTGESGLFEELAGINIANFKKFNVKKIVALSPHDYQTIKNEYPKLDGKFEVVHYTQMLDELIQCGKIKLSKKLNMKVTYQDPCFLGRYNGVYDAPRNVLKAIPGLTLVEIANPKEQTQCCGGGGGGNWLDVRAGERLGERRVGQAVATGAAILAVGCSFCVAMFEDAVKTKGYEEKFAVKQIAELVAEAM